MAAALPQLDGLTTQWREAPGLAEALSPGGG